MERLEELQDEAEMGVWCALCPGGRVSGQQRIGLGTELWRDLSQIFGGGLWLQWPSQQGWGVCAYVRSFGLPSMLGEAAHRWEGLFYGGEEGFSPEKGSPQPSLEVRDHPTGVPSCSNLFWNQRSG